MDDVQRAVAELAREADRLDALAEIAELMGDDDGALRMRAEGERRRAQAMHLLDERPPGPA